jgi:hypothetical protein
MRYREDVCKISDISESALYFETHGHYYEGMNVSLARNFQLADSTHHEEPAKIVRTRMLKRRQMGRRNPHSLVNCNQTAIRPQSVDALDELFHYSLARFSRFTVQLSLAFSLIGGQF